MKRVFLHSKKVFGNHWFIICIAGSVSFVFGIGLFLIFLVYSLYFKEDPIDVNDLMNNFTEEELNIALAETVDENVSDEEYLQILARYQSYFCPKKVDEITKWVGSEVNSDSYTMYYEVSKNYEAVDHDKLKQSILSQINKYSVQTTRVARSHRNLVFRYTSRKSGEFFDIVVNNRELKAA